MKEKIKDAFCRKPDWKVAGIYLLWAFVVTLIMETLSRFHANGVLTGGIFGGVKTIFNQPFVFFYTVLLMVTMLSVSLLFRRNYFVAAIISIVWIGFTVADFVLLSYRVTPFSVIEFKLIEAALGVMTKYIPIPMLICLIIVIILAGVGLFFLWTKVPKAAVINRFRSACIIAALLLASLGVTALGISQEQLTTRFPNLANAYLENGFIYAFLQGIDTGIHKPANYSSEKVSEIVSGTSAPISTEAVPPTEEPIATLEPNYTGPNVIFLQLESFFDVTAVTELQLSADPVPFFRSLKQTCSSGYLSVPAIGAGTANTEFEVMTGMNLDFFGPGEYPYKTVLETNTCESIAYDMKEDGYKAHAIHNNRANFYSRDLIFSQLGYDDFTSIEVMNIPDTEYTPNGWAKDKCLTKEIMKVMNATPERDVVYTISVQGHGKYPKEQLIENPAITVLGGIDEERKFGVEYYVNEIYEMDQFLQELVQTLGSFGEPVVLVAYGDHLPGLGFTKEDLINGDMNQTEYVVWTNCEWGKIDEDLQAYQLSSRIMERIGVKAGVINSYHQTHKNTSSPSYLEDLKILCYDMLYGTNEANGGQNKYEATDLAFGVTNVEISSVKQEIGDPQFVTIKGNYFTQYSRVMCGEQKLTSILLDEHTIRAELPEFDEGETLPIVVLQSYKGKLTLQTSNEVMITPEPIKDSNYGEDFQDNNENFGNEADINEIVNDNKTDQ